MKLWSEKLELGNFKIERSRIATFLAGRAIDRKPTLQISIPLYETIQT
jgi:hypothetical protein